MNGYLVYVAEKNRKFRICLIPATLLWGLALCCFIFIASVWLAGCCVVELTELTSTSDICSSWSPLFGAAIIAWLLPVGMCFRGRLVVSKGKLEGRNHCDGGIVVGRLFVFDSFIRGLGQLSRPALRKKSSVVLGGGQS
ncbi:MAG: hypothetical protein JW959_10300 [Pirellulales bacterium]|nr:hypothetical protein [Pirellulales bacterium]